MPYLHQIGRPNPFAKATHRFERKMIETNFGTYWDLRDIMTALPHLKFKDGYTLDAYYAGDMDNANMKLYAYRMDSMDVYDPGSPGVHRNPKDRFSGLFSKEKAPEPIPFRDGQVVTGTISYAASDTVPSIENYLDIDFTPQAIWEALLLIEEADNYLLHCWHGGYANGRLIVDRLSLIQSCHGHLSNKEYEPVLFGNRLMPGVCMQSDDEALIHYCRWGDWSGLNYITIKAIRNGRTLSFERMDTECLIEYDCGIRF